MINVDAATFKKPSRMGVGFVVRDHRGDFIAACCQLIQRFDDPELAKAIEIRRAQFAASYCDLWLSEYY